MIAVTLLLVVAIPVVAATTSVVTVTFTSTSIVLGTTTPNSWAAGNIADSGTAETATGYFTTDNTSNVATDVTISVENATWIGGSAYTHAEDGNPGASTVGLKASPNTGAFNIIVKNASPNNLVASQTANTDIVWELKLWAPTSGSNTDQKLNTVILTASAS
jgi:hypothetical protein